MENKKKNLKKLLSVRGRWLLVLFFLLVINTLGIGVRVVEADDIAWTSDMWSAACAPACVDAGNSGLAEDVYFQDVRITSITNGATYKEGQALRIRGYVKLNKYQETRGGDVTGMYMAIGLNYDTTNRMPSKDQCTYTVKECNNCWPPPYCCKKVEHNCGNAKVMYLYGSSKRYFFAGYYAGITNSKKGVRVPLTGWGSGRRFNFDFTYIIPNSSAVGINNNPNKLDSLVIYPSFELDNVGGHSFNLGLLGKYIYIKPNKVDGQCGFLTNSCVAGSFRDKPDSPSQWLWDCVGTGGGATAPCAKDKPPVNGQCPPPSWPVNSCTKGSLQDVPDTDSHWFWNCLGSRGGITAHCSRLKPPINGQCGWRINHCLKGDFQDKPDSPTQYLWLCLGRNGGSTARCFRNKIQPQCGSVAGGHYDSLNITDPNLCSLGSPGASFTQTPHSGDGRWVWTCHNDGLTVSCTAFQNGACHSNPTSDSNACQRGYFENKNCDDKGCTWQCGQGANGDNYYPVNCTCDSTITYSCQKPPESSLDCTGKCGQTVQADYIPMKIVSTCLETHTTGILDKEYKDHKGKSCAANKATKTCPPCTHGSIYESN